MPISNFGGNLFRRFQLLAANIPDVDMMILCQERRKVCKFGISIPLVGLCFLIITFSRYPNPRKLLPLTRMCYFTIHRLFSGFLEQLSVCQFQVKSDELWVVINFFWFVNLLCFWQFLLPYITKNVCTKMGNFYLETYVAHSPFTLFVCGPTTEGT